MLVLAPLRGSRNSLAVSCELTPNGTHFVVFVSEPYALASGFAQH